MEDFYLRHQRWPQTLAELPANPWPAPPLDLIDDWSVDGEPYVFSYAVNAYLIGSLGANRTLEIAVSTVAEDD